MGVKSINSSTDTVAEPDTQPSLELLESSDSGINTDVLKTTAIITATGVAGRVALQHVPSVEPLIAVAAATGFYFGTKEGMIAGGTGYYLSNFLVYGGQGPWTAFQVAGAALAGASGGLIGKASEGKYAFLSSAVVGVLIYEILVNIGSLGFASFTGVGIGYLAAALPFTATHIASTIGFGLMLYGSKEKIGLYRKN
jgi:hypothetical protein